MELSALLPPPLTPPHKGEGAANAAMKPASIEPGTCLSESPSPLWGGARGGGNGLSGEARA
jgi:hypothetical protein